jgi:D-glycero-D-manno-heptose 1,7-bisphosphate phosphatase
VTTLILLDRDGVLNHDSPAYVKSVEEFRPIPGALETVARLHRAGFRVGVCTNQSAVGRGLISISGLEAIHRELRARLAALGAELVGIRYCPHLPDADCECRKPRPGMLKALMDATGSAPAATLFVGDSLRDLQAAAAAGCEGALVRTGNGARTEPEARALGVARIYDDLSALGDELLAAGPGR